MNPKQGQHIKIVFRNGLVEEGYVVSWTDTKSVLKALPSDNLFVIQKTLDDVMAFKIVASQAEQKKEETYSAPSQPDTKKELLRALYPIEALCQREDPEPPHIKDPTLRAKKLVELHDMRISSEKEIIRKHLTTFTNNGNYGVEYGLPGKLSRPPDLDSRKKTK